MPHERERTAGGPAETSVSGDSVRSPRPNSSPDTDTPGAAGTIPERIGRFVVTGVLGSGSFARVYRAKDPGLGRDVAIKVPLPDALRTPADRERFLREARAAASLHHPNICPIHEVGEQNGRPYVVTGFVPGHTLAAAIKARKAPFAPKQAALIIRKLALALEAAHQRGVVHRDLKPATVMFDRDRKDVVLTDLGLVPGAGDTDTAANVGDLGRILHAMLAGPAGVPSGTDPHLEAVGRRATATGFRSMRELADALGAYLAAARGPEPVPMATPVPDTLPVPAPTVDPAPWEDMLAAFASDARAETEAAVEQVVRRTRASAWRWLAAVGLVAAAAIVAVIVLARPTTVAVKIPVTERELADRSLSFFLDDRPVSAEALAAPVELAAGEHKLVIRRGDSVVRTVVFVVRKGEATPEVRQDTGPVPESRPAEKVPKNDRESPAGGAQRQAALHILRKGGSVRVMAAGAAPPRLVEDYAFLPTLTEPGQLPAAFQVVTAAFPQRSATDADLAILSRIDTLVEVWLVDSDDVTDAGLKALAAQKHLVSLQLDGTKVTDAGLKHLAGMTHLQYLHLARNSVHGTGLAALRDLPLRRLILGQVATDAGLEGVGAIPSLTELSLEGPDLTDQGVRHLRGLARLESLTIAAPKLSDAALREVAQLKKLAGLGLNGAAISDEGLGHLSGLPALRRLGLSGTKVTDQGLASLRPLTSIHELTLNNSGISDRGVKHLLLMKNLKVLTLVNSAVTAAAVDDLVKMNWLESVNLEGAKVTRADLSHLRRSLPRTTVIPDLRSPSDLVIESVLDQGGTVSLQDHEQPVGKLKDVPTTPVRLRGISLEGRKVTGAVLEQAGRVSGLEFLVLSKAVISDDAWARLKDLSGLERLELADTGLTNERLAALADLASLTTLNLAGNRLDDGAVKDLARLRNLTTLDLSRTAVTDAGVEEFRKARPNCQVKR